MTVFLMSLQQRREEIDIKANPAMFDSPAWIGCLPIAFSGQTDNVFADMVNALSNSDVDAAVDDEPAFGSLLKDPRYKLAFTINALNLWGGTMQKHQSQLEQAFNLALNHLIDIDLLADIWGRHLEAIAYPSHDLNKQPH